DALASYLIEAHPEAGEWPIIQKLRKLVAQFYWGALDDKPDDYRPNAKVPVDLAELRRGVKEAEETAVEEARKQLAELEGEHAAYTKAWVKATSDLQQNVLKTEMDRLEAEISAWKPRTVPLSERVKVLFAAEAEREAERQKLLAEWPTLENRE